MSGFEIVGVILGLGPLVFAGYGGVRQFLRDYNELDHNICMALRAFDKEMDIFRLLWHTLLGGHSRQNEVERWLMDTLNPTQRSALDSSLREMKPEQLKILSGALEESRDVVLKVNGILPKLRGVFREEGPHLTRLMAGPLSLFVPIHQATQTHTSGAERIMSSMQPRKRRIKLLRKDILGQLKGLAREIHTCNESLHIVVDCRKTAPKDRDGAINGKVVSHVVVNRARRDAMVIRTASTRVYQGVIESSLHCGCHLVHLRLDTPSILESTTDVVEYGQPLPEARAATKLFFQLTKESKDKRKRTYRHLKSPAYQFFFTHANYAATASAVACAIPICQGLVGSDNGYRRFFPDNNGNGQGGFLLHHTTSDEVINSERISFQQLVSSRSHQLLQRDILLIAANLAHSILHFHSSPWARDWTSQTIQFFQKYGSPGEYSQPTFTPHLWTPHLFLHSRLPSPHPDRTATSSKAIYDLGMMMLELGGKHPLALEGLSPWERGMVLEGALRNLKQLMGAPFSRMVSKYLKKWSVTDVDLMGEESLSMFLSDILLLETLADGFRD